MFNEEQQQTDLPEEEVPYVPSPVSRRIWAWMGVAYALIIMVLLTYWIATGSLIEGITGIMLFPLLGAMSGQGWNNLRLCRKGEHGGNAAVLGITAGMMGLLALASLVWGVAELMSRLGG